MEDNYGQAQDSQQVFERCIFFLLPAVSQEQGFLVTVTQRLLYWISTFNRCTETGDCRVREGQREMEK